MPSNSATSHSSNRSSAQSLAGKVLCIDIDDIELFEKNPRRNRNPAYDRIKSSILANGLDQPLIVTRRPGCEKFVVHAGGNTRLQILKELYASSGDPEFAIVNCIYVSWDNESGVLLAHLRENDLRGDLTFIDKAVAICALEDLLTEESGRQEYSVRQLEDALKQRGYSISTALISNMRYAVNFLLPTMPVALSDGLPRSQIQRIRRLQRVGGKIWRTRDIGSEEEFDGIFGELCRRYDSPDWQFDALTRAVETEIAEATDCSVQVIRMEMDFLASGRKLCDEIPEIELPPEDLPKSNGDADEANRKASRDDNGGGAPVSVSLTMPTSTAGDLLGVFGKSECIDTVRFRAYEHAESLARRYGLGDLVLPLPDLGLGFLLSDVPPKDALERVDNELRAAMCTMWWQLVGFSELTLAPVELLEPMLAIDGELLSVLQDGNSRLLFDRVRVVDPGSFAGRFWSRLSQEDWADWLYLAHCYRELNRLSIEQERPLWGPPS